MGRAPVIGIVGSGHVVPRHFGALPVTGTPTPYVEAIVSAGARPVVLPGPAALDLLDEVDGLVLTGGGDLDPRLYGGVQLPGGTEPGMDAGVDPVRDRVEIAVAREAARRGLPVLGACRGLQVLVVAFGGSLVGDLGMSHVCPERGHPVRAERDSLVACLLGHRPHVSSLHHQAVAASGPAWRPTAWAADGVVEAAEWVGPDPWPVLGVQWHPELDATGNALFGWLVDAA